MLILSQIFVPGMGTADVQIFPIKIPNCTSAAVC
jgi:hypothetical protein